MIDFSKYNEKLTIMKKNFCFIVLLLLFASSINAQKGFRIEVGIGPTIGDSREYDSFTLQGNFYYLWNVSENIDIGATTGVLVFLGEGDEPHSFSEIPNVYIPMAIATRIKLSKVFSAGLDIGYGFNLDSERGGFYIRPVIAYNLKEKLALIGSYGSISEIGYTASTINLGVNFGF